MLTVHSARYRHLAAREEQAFLQRLQAKLERDEPALLPRFPPRQRAAIVANICRRARAVGATWESAIGAWGGYMVGIAPNLGRDPAVRAWLASTGATPDETITRLPDLLTEADWARVQAHRSDLPLYLPPEADSHPLASRVAEALPLALWDLVPPERAQEYAQAAIAASTTWDDLSGLARGAWDVARDAPGAREQFWQTTRVGAQAVADHGAQAIDDPARVWNDARATVGRAYTAGRQFATQADAAQWGEALGGAGFTVGSCCWGQAPPPRAPSWPAAAPKRSPVPASWPVEACPMPRPPPWRRAPWPWQTPSARCACAKTWTPKVAPRTGHAVMHLLPGRATGRAGQQGLFAFDIEVEAVLGCVEPNVPHSQRRLPAQCAGEQGFDLNAHAAPQQFNSRPVDMWTGSNAACPHAHRARPRPAILNVAFHTKRRGAEENRAHRADRKAGEGDEPNTGEAPVGRKLLRLRRPQPGCGQGLLDQAIG